MYLKNLVFQIIYILINFALRSTFGESTSYCQNFNVQVRRFGLKNGFHRDLLTVMEWDGLKACKILIEETLPCGIYVDVDQLANTANHSTSKVVSKERVNVESPADKADSQYLLVYPSDKPSELRENHFRLSVKVPFHLRYHQPVPGKAFESVLLSPPSILINCADTRILERCKHRTVKAPCDETEKELCEWIDPTKEKGSQEHLEFKVPIGMMSHRFIVTMTTALTTLGGMVWTTVMMMKSPS
ncbi:phosphatidylinositol-glycan biosynthesis class X protein-like [Actinia tenebrosa]|uniref:Phosphatidylinositol-glycan biosynthesis class X protein n=1 Tax=Actinia tenebrosa TaxID=6105 RepID=A0A6P8HRM9_ACTTE|nr:phosphatidylinositol-glycan biosynthesis class X protein-like [Actinia tenebrosa]